MASEVLVSDRSRSIVQPPRAGGPLWVGRLLDGLASLRLTVLLFALSIVLVLAGTLAQLDHDVWNVVRHLYFRVWFCKLSLQLFLPRSWEVPTWLAIPYPGGATLGLLLAANLFAAHLRRFKVQASGSRQMAGWAVMLIGSLLTLLVVRSGSGGGEVADQPILSYESLWQLFSWGTLLLVMAGAYQVFTLGKGRGSVRLLYGGLVAVGIVLCYFLFSYPDFRLDESGMRILWQLLKGASVGILFWLGCELLFQRRAGIVLIHLGVALLMLGELLVAKKVVEGHMTIVQGQTVHHAVDIRGAELAVIDANDPDQDRVSVVPAALLRDGKRLAHPGLPFDIRVVAYHQNAEIVKRHPGDANPATQGEGTEFSLRPRRPVASIGGEQESLDLPAAYLEFFEKGTDQSLGTYLCYTSTAEPHPTQTVTASGRSYELDLRFIRLEKPYAITLRKFRKDNYAGTDTPRNYSAEIRLVDPTRSVDRECRIWMNNPLRYQGETFYQSSFLDVNGVPATQLSVVENPNWIIPYVSCMMLLVGMAVHFGKTLTRFLQRRQSRVSVPSSRRGNSRTEFWIPLAAGIFAALYVLSHARGPREAANEMHLAEFGRLPISHEGRLKPMDTLARLSLRSLAARQEFTNEKGQRRPAVQWLLEVFTQLDRGQPAGDGEPAQQGRRVFRIDHPELLTLLGLESREGHLYALSEFDDKLDALDKEMEQAANKKEGERTEYDAAVRKLSRRLQTYLVLTASTATPETEELPSVNQLAAAFDQYEKMQIPQIIPWSKEGKQDWLYYPIAVQLDRLQGNNHRAPSREGIIALSRMLSAFRKQDVAGFNQQLDTYREWLESQLAGDGSLNKVHAEAWFNQADPFYYLSVVYGMAFLLAIGAWIGAPQLLNRSAAAVLISGLVLHAAAIVVRIYITGRPPVTSLYSSTLFISLGIVLMGLAFEVIFRLGLGLVIGSFGGFLTLLLSLFLAREGDDTIRVLQAVLDTQFWLATHVVCISLGYVTTLVAGLFGMFYILRGLFSARLEQAVAQQADRMIYGSVCFAIFFSLIGTILGGLWADDSWGRFWGWDSKENGALMIVLYNALILHARWGGLVRKRGLAMLAVGGNITTVWAWFGTNQLGVGLHSYGFTKEMTTILIVTILSQLIIIGLGAWSKSEEGPATGTPSSPAPEAV